MKKILITSGGTKEYIDDVRVLTNISTGKLGAEIAANFLEKNVYKRHTETEIKYEVHYVSSSDTVKPSLSRFFNTDEIYYHQVTDVQSVYNIMEELVPQMDIVIHCMAVSDFGFTPCSTKLKSSDPEAFIDSLKNRIKMNPKILPLIKQWNPNCKLVSFKFEVGLSHDDLIKIARTSMISGNSDIVIANDKTEMVREKEHIAYAISLPGFIPCKYFAALLNKQDSDYVENDSYHKIKLNGKKEIANFLYEILK